MGTWNYRVVKNVTPREEIAESIRHIPTDDDLVSFGIHAAYYDEDGKISGVADKPATLLVDSVKDFEFFAIRIPEAMRKPILQRIEGKWIEIPPVGL